MKKNFYVAVFLPFFRNFDIAKLLVLVCNISQYRHGQTVIVEWGRPFRGLRVKLITIEYDHISRIFGIFFWNSAENRGNVLVEQPHFFNFLMLQ